MNPETIKEIEAHYTHACTKHPYFADLWSNGSSNAHAANAQRARREIYEAAKNGEVTAALVLQAEISEIMKAATKGEMGATCYEIYDAIAVLLRMLDVAQRRAAFGLPPTPAAPAADRA